MGYEVWSLVISMHQDLAAISFTSIEGQHPIWMIDPTTTASIEEPVADMRRTKRRSHGTGPDMTIQSAT
jgi:hypothetical protein